jgi:SAM-dependent methyltransferase
MSFSLGADRIGGFSENDGTIDFYLRVNTLINSDSVVLDMGAGRASWFEDDKCELRKSTRLIKGKVKSVIAIDLDDAVMENLASDQQLVLSGSGEADVPDNSVDVVVCDYVLEHVDNVDEFYYFINRVLKPNGWFCARTPHKFSYVAIFASLIRNKSHAKALSYIQPTRKEIDVFPTVYKLNSFYDIGKYFSGWSSKSFIYRTEPAYYFGNKFIYNIIAFIHRILPAFFVGNLFVFLKK